MAGEHETDRPGAGPDAAPPGTSRLEWAAAVLGGLFVVAVVGYLVFDGLAGRDGRPAITVTATHVAKVADGYAVEIAVVNAGGTALDVDIRGRILRGGSVADESTVTLAELPGRSRREAGLLFAEDPGDGLELRAVGWTRP